MVNSPLFPATRWTLLRSLREGSDQESKEALEILCRAYWTPLYLVARRRGLGRHDAEDAVQGFFQHVLRKQVLERADPQLGKLRTFLLTSFDNYQRKQWQAGQRPSVETLSIADAELMEGAEDYFQELAADQAEPEKLYLRAWARLTLERSLDKLREEQAEETARQRFDQLAPHLVQEGDGEKLTEVATRLGISETACRQALFRLRKQYRDKIREELALTLGTQDPDEIQQELQVLFQAFEG